MLDEVESGIGGHLTLTGVEFGLCPLNPNLPYNPGQVGMLDEAESGIGGHLTLTGVEFGELAPLDQASAVARLSVFARVEPSHKSALVDALREQVCCARCVVACLVVYIFSKNINHAVQTRVSCPNFPSP